MTHAWSEALLLPPAQCVEVALSQPSLPSQREAGDYSERKGGAPQEGCPPFEGTVLRTSLKQVPQASGLPDFAFPC